MLSVYQTFYSVTSAKSFGTRFSLRTEVVVVCRVPETTNVKSADTLLTICAQRELDGLMKSISKPDVLTRLYFASVEGPWRTFPGSVLQY